MKTISNGEITIDVATHGAELQSIRRAGKEYLWQGDPAFWGRRSPVLFPIVGRLLDNTYRLGSETYHLGQHGFGRDMDFELVESTADSLTFRLVSSEVTRENYPFDFSLEISYKLRGKSVIVGWRVVNTGNVDLPFQIGAHPAFLLPDFKADGKLRGYFRFDRTDALTYIIPAEKGCVGPEKFTLTPGPDRVMPIFADTFDIDTYIFENSQLKRIELLKPDMSSYISVEFTAPLVALWAPTATKPDCPFVCIEPWYGRCDSVGFDGDFTERAWMNTLPPAGVFEASYAITIDE